MTELFETPPYDFIDNGVGDLMLVYDADRTAPNHPLFYFNGENALLKRTEKQSVLFPFISNAVKKLLTQNKKLVITEMNGEETVRSYEAEILLTDQGKLPPAG